jgi:uncharacterized phage-associated protein
LAIVVKPEAPGKDLSRLKELILLVAKKSESDSRFGAVKLNKLLFYMDMRAFRELGHSISEATYQRLREGPAPREMLPAIHELDSEDAIEVVVRQFYDRPQKRVLARRDPNVEAFTAPEREIVDAVIDELFYMNGTQLSQLSHEEWGWKLAADGETIPNEASWLSSGPLSQDQIAAGQVLWNETAVERG